MIMIYCIYICSTVIEAGEQNNQTHELATIAMKYTNIVWRLMSRQNPMTNSLSIIIEGKITYAK